MPLLYEPPEPGLHLDATRDDYESWDAARGTLLKIYDAACPLKAREAELHPEPPTPALTIGDAIHVAILEPERFEAEYVAGLTLRRQGRANLDAWAAFELENAGKTIIKPDELETAKAISRSVRAHPMARELIDSEITKTEVAITWRDPDVGVMCKALIDLIGPWQGWTVIGELKSAVDASREGFKRAISNYNYHLSASFYIDGLNELFPEDRRFTWIVTEKKRPFATATWEPTPTMVYEGRRAYKKALAEWKRCRERGVWPSYNRAPEGIELPKWKRTDEEDDL